MYTYTFFNIHPMWKDYVEKTILKYHFSNHVFLKFILNFYNIFLKLPTKRAIMSKIHDHVNWTEDIILYSQMYAYHLLFK